MRAILKQVLFTLGVARLLHWLRNRSVLTVLMLHRVLPPEDPRFAGANPTYTVTRQEFAQSLDLFRRWYSVVDLAAVERAATGVPLPPCPMLITFDDGWRDNFEYALPELRARGLPAVLFVATDYIGDEQGFWQERVFDCAVTADAGPHAIAAAERRVRELDAAGPDARAAALASVGERHLPRRMADVAELRMLQQAGIVIGGHGQSHTPMTLLAEPEAELTACRAALNVAGLGGARPPFSFPHGRANEALVAAAREAGFGLCFTSAAELTNPADLAAADGIGRLGLNLGPMRRPGGLDLSALAFALLTLPHSAKRR